MTYTPTVWKDRVVQNPHQYKDQDNNVLILTRDAGVVTEEGTPITASLMTKIEDGIESVTSDVGDITTLDTDDKSNVASAINEIVANVLDIKEGVLIDTLTTIGASNYIVPTGITKIAIVMIGAGGGGGSGDSAGTSSYAYAGGGGGGGYIATIPVMTVTPSQSIPVVIGDGGLGGVWSGAPNDGADGGTTSFNGITCKGGGKGLKGTTSAHGSGGVGSSNGGAGGANVGQNSGGNVNNIYGFAGAGALNIIDGVLYGAGGGGGARAQSAGGLIGANGGTSPLGTGGKGGNGGSSSTGGTFGLAGAVGCGGGGGGSSGNNQSTANIYGGKGGQGRILIYKVL